MKIFIESTLSSTASGNIELNTTPNATVDSLINAFCIEKGIRHRSHYVLKTQENIVLDNIKTLASSGINDEDLLFLTTKNEEDRVFGFNNWWTMAAVALTIAAIGLTATIVIYVSSTSVMPCDYGIVFDAGSTHTDMFLYEWKGDKVNGTGVIQQMDSCQLKGGGIEDFAANPELLKNDFYACLNQTTKNIPIEEKKKSHIYLGATAGMRLLNMSNPVQSAKIMSIIDDILNNSGFAYQSGQARIITGEEEGIFAWITSNFLLKKLEQAEHSDTVGILDLGGASTQITYQIPSNSSSINENVFDLSLFGNPYKVYSTSALCYGKSEMEKRFKVNLLLDIPDGSTEVMNPCGYIGKNETVHSSDFINNECTVTQSQIQLPENVIFIGNSNAEQCKLKIEVLFNFSHCQDHYLHCFNYQELPEMTETSFYGINGYVYVLQFFNVSDKDSLEDVIEKVDSFCNKTWEEVKGIPVPNGTLEFLLQYCFDGQYVLHLLTKELKFDSSSWKNLHFQNGTNGVSFDWAFGFMTNTTNSIPADIPEYQPQESITLPVFVCLVVLFSAFFLVAAAFGYHAWKHGHRSSSYQRFSQYGAI